MYYCILLYLFLFIFIQCSVQQQTRIWIPNTNYDDNKNWLNQELPCESTTAIFPSNLYAEIYMPANIKVKEIVLPDNGELLLRRDSKLDVTGINKSQTCNKTISYFKNINIEPWFKPKNWKSTNLENDAIPHIERVPCMHDKVIFPKDRSVWVEYPEVPVSVKSFQIEGKILTNDELQSFLISEPGSRQFKNRDYQLRTDVITVKNQKCSDKSGCRCHKYSTYVTEAVCSYVRRLCPELHCIKPVKSYGHCCEFCGAYLELNFDNDFELLKFKEQVHQYLIDYSDLNIHISKVYNIFNDVIQVVIREKNDYKGYSVTAATALHEKIMANLKLFKISHSILYTSGAEYWPYTQLKSSIAIVLGTLAAVLVLLSIIYIIYGPLQEKDVPFKLPFHLPNMATLRPYLFVRFENSGDADGGLEFRNRSVASSLFNLDRAFDNPLYGEPLPSTSQTTDETGTETSDMLEFKNPLYSDLKKQESSDVEE